MTEPLRGGNSRALARVLDQLSDPMAALDRRGVILFVNQALCQLAGVEARQLAGLQCSWQLAEDDNPQASLLTALAPPSGALQGKIVARRLTAPVVFGSTATGQLFIPLVDDDQVPQLTVVVLGDWDRLQQQIPHRAAEQASALNRRAEQTLIAMRSRWKSLDSLLAMVGESPWIELAMARAQQAIAGDAHCLLSGPRGSGKTEVIHGIHAGRLRRLALQPVTGQLLPLDCSTLSGELFAGMLEVFAGRLRDSLPRGAQTLLLENLDALDEAPARTLAEWLVAHQASCTVAATSRHNVRQLMQRGQAWIKLAAQVSQIEIELPPLCERPADVPVLAQHLVAQACRQHQRAQLTLAPATLDLLTCFPWPGNLRQLSETLEHAVQHAVLTLSIQPQHLPVEVRSYPSSIHQAERCEPIELDAVLEEMEKILIGRALNLSPRNRAQAARLLGISRPRLLRRIVQLGLASPATDADDELESSTNVSVQ